MSKLVYETRENNQLIREVFHKGRSTPNLLGSHGHSKKEPTRNMALTGQSWNEVDNSPQKPNGDLLVEEHADHRASSNSRSRVMVHSNSRSRLEKADRSITEEAE